MRGYDYEVVGDKIAEMVGDFYERELEIRDADIKRLRQQVEDLALVARGAAYRIEDAKKSQRFLAMIDKAVGGK